MSGRRLIPAVCQLCGAQYRARPDHLQRSKFCSRSCRSQSVARETASRRGDLQRGSGEGRGYRKLGGRHEHRVIAEQTLGRPLRPGEVVHHRDGDRHNNDPGNLQVMTQAQHMREHGLGIPGRPLLHEPWKQRR